MYLIKDSRCSLRASFHLSASFPTPKPLTPSPREQGLATRESSTPLAQRVGRCAPPTDGKLWSWGSAALQAPSRTNLRGSRIQPTRCFHAFKAIHLHPQTGWKQPSLAKVFPPQGHPNTYIQTQTSVSGGRDCLSPKVFLLFHTTSLWSSGSMCYQSTSQPRHHSEKGTEDRFQSLTFISTIFCWYTPVLLHLWVAGNANLLLSLLLWNQGMNEEMKCQLESAVRC